MPVTFRPFEVEDMEHNGLLLYAEHELAAAEEMKRHMYGDGEIAEHITIEREGGDDVQYYATNHVFAVYDADDELVNHFIVRELVYKTPMGEIPSPDDDPGEWRMAL